MAIEIRLRKKYRVGGRGKKRGGGGSASGAKAQSRFRGPSMLQNPQGYAKANLRSIFNKDDYPLDTEA
jgi:hypothetical protein